MNEIDRTALEMVHNLASMPTDKFYWMKCIIMANATFSENVYNFMRVVFELAEEKRPLLLVMKDGVA